MDLRLAGHTALVAGSTSGLGEAVAIALGGEGANVVIGGRRQLLAAQVASKLSSAIGLALDMADPASIEAVAEAAEKAFGRVDILVLNTGGPPPATAAGLSEPLLMSGLDTLLVRQVQLVERFLPDMRSQGWGRVLGIGSSGVQEPLADLVISNMARGALAAYLKTLSGEVAAEGVTVNMVLPGRIDTERVAALDRIRAERQGITATLARQRSEQSIPIGRYGSPGEFAAVACFLCSELASYVTGEQIRVDGGLARGF
ncbi:MAG: SDR family oxidoreductase [Candidatus Dormibacteria bacterium]